MRYRSKISSMDIHLYVYSQDMHNISRSSDFGATYGDFVKNVDMGFSQLL